MNNFTLWNPTRIHFGEGQIAKITEEIPKTEKVLVLYGGGSIKKNGVYDQVKAALEGYDWAEFGGIEPNPTYATLMKAVETIKAEGITYLLAVGGGSTIDGTKFISAAVHFEGEPWDILAKWAPIEKAMPFGSVLTLPATGSEMNMGFVVTKKDTKEKRGRLDSNCYPKFSILDPTTTYTLPEKQISNGVVDAFVHTMEQYLTYPAHAPIQDGWSETILRTLIENGPVALKEPKNYEVRTNVMWAATLALNGYIGSGVPQDWATHMIGHELTAEYGMDHGQTLAVVLPSTMNRMRQEKKEKILQYGERIWGIDQGTDDEKIDLAIEKTRSFFESLGVKTRLGDYGANKDQIPTLIERLKEKGMVELGEHQNITLEVSAEILEASF